MISLIFRQATDNDMYDVMDIRNNGREYMTHHTEEITPEQQYDWWTSKDNNLYRIWVVTIYVQPYGTEAESESEEVIVGFCMLRTMPDGLVWGTLAVDSDWRKQGIGTAIYRFMREQADEVWLEIQNANIASYRAAYNAGFRPYYANSEFVTLFSRKERE